MTLSQRLSNKSRIVRLLPASASLGLLSLLGTPPVEAQQLTVGGSSPGMAAISGAGTTASGTYAFADGAGPGTTHYKEVDVSDPNQVTPADPPDLTLQAGGAIDSLSSMTASILVTGGSLGYANCDYGTLLSVQGGSVQSINALNGSQVNVSGGTVNSAGSAYTGGINVTGGSVGQIEAGNDGYASISRGTVKDAMSYDGYLTISGGSVTTAENFEDGSFLTVSGGTVQTVQNDVGGGQVKITGGQFQFIDNAGGEIDVFGSNLKATLLNGDPAVYDSSFSLLLTGTLQNGDTLDATYNATPGDSQNPVLNFNGHAAPVSAPVPEASSTVGLGLMLALGLGGLVVAAHKRRKPAA